MGIYINKGNLEFSEFLDSDYVDKTELIKVINERVCKLGRYSCVTRCRRFGKSMAAKMLCAYYDKSCDSRDLFQGLKISSDESFEKHLNKYSVLYLDVTTFTSQPRYHGRIVKSIQNAIIKDVKKAFPNVKYEEDDDLMGCLETINEQTGERFFFIIDEWDAICREFPSRRKFKNNTVEVEATEMDEYVMFLRRLFKTQTSDKVFVGAYITGILPMIKYQTESALNNFWEYSMVNPRAAAGSFGFTPEEVKGLCTKFDMEYEEMAAWYDGYQIGKEPSIFNPNSVMNAMYARECSSYWASTGAYDKVAEYIKMNFDGLKDDIIKMLAGETCKVNSIKFNNNMSEVESRDDVLTVLIHLGYLGYNSQDKTCYVPNKEVRDELINAVETTDWNNIVQILSQSEDLLKATISGDTDKVAKMIDNAHQENTSILSYNDENSLSCVISLAYIYARNEYIIHREPMEQRVQSQARLNSAESRQRKTEGQLATGKGFADLVFIPRKNVDKPAMVIELKYNKDADAAIDQIKRNEYPAKVQEYLDTCPLQDSCGGALLLVGINYDKDTKTHSCVIEKYMKE